ncbi:phosphonopyruvate decarboxylase [Gammaproteobacteria bacterium]|nr:phosphonopyruvate decarboxylase [Gammaproteobacteria bacterium]
MSIKPADAFERFKQEGVDFFAGVPDSLLKNFCSFADKNLDNDQHVITANEGSAIAISIGYHLATGKTPMVYMQNSGLGNAVNPLLSLADEKVYSIPMILMIGWRGQPGVQDEPQHIKQGEVTENMLDAMQIETFTLDKNSSLDIINSACISAKINTKPVAILVKQNTFSEYKSTKQPPIDLLMTREDIIKVVARSADNYNYSIVSTTGVTSRELFEYRADNNLGHANDFLTVGGMGHASQIALGLGMFAKNKNILCLDGDGAFLMHTGSIAEIGARSVKGFKHIVINNGCHDSVGGQPTRAGNIDLNKIASSFGYKVFPSCSSESELKNNIDEFLSSEDCSFLEIKAKPGFRKELGRPTTTPLENKICFMQSIQE